FAFPPWQLLIEAERHHLEFLARPFTLHTLLYRIVPDLMIWLRIPDSQLLILNQERRYFDMHVYRQGQLWRSRRVTRKNIIPMTRMLRQFGAIAKRDDINLPADIATAMEKYQISIGIPFIHRGRLLGMLLFKRPTSTRYSDRALELFAVKAAITIHDHILKSRMRNIAEYDEELRVATKIRQMLQMDEVPKPTGWQIKPGQIRSATLVEYFPVKNDTTVSLPEHQFVVFLSTKAAGGVQAMILSGALGYLFAQVRLRGPSIRLSTLIRKMTQYVQENDLEGKLEIMIHRFRVNHSDLDVWISGKSYRIFNSEIGELSLGQGRHHLYCKENIAFSIYYQEEEIMSFSKTH
ncbi:MAG: hypothetical protein H3C43_12105, partial [Leptonema sp. (in: Bacteria)]|nr:hypothetical protein [Leptonema sp. (in: bacteria)]